MSVPVKNLKPYTILTLVLWMRTAVCASSRKRFISWGGISPLMGVG